MPGRAPPETSGTRDGAGACRIGTGTAQHARAALEAGRSIARRQGRLSALTAFLLNLFGELGTAMGEREQAEEWLVANVKLQHIGGERWPMTQSLERYAALDARRGQSERVLQLAMAADAPYRRTIDRGGKHPPAAWLTPVDQRGMIVTRGPCYARVRYASCGVAPGGWAGRC